MVSGSLNLHVNVVSSTGLGLESGEPMHIASGKNVGRNSVLAPPPSHIQLHSNATHAHVTKQMAFGNHGIHHQSNKNVTAEQSAGSRTHAR